MDVDEPVVVAAPPKPVNAFGALMAGAKANKGKEKAAEVVDDREGLPWCVASPPSSQAELTLPRVEKYRPITLDEVVSHHDITATSGSFLRARADAQSRSLSRQDGCLTCCSTGRQVSLAALRRS